LSGCARNLKKECVGLVAGQAVLIALNCDGVPFVRVTYLCFGARSVWSSSSGEESLNKANSSSFTSPRSCKRLEVRRFFASV